MAKAKNNLSRRLLAAVLSILLVLSTIPFSMTAVLAATDENPYAGVTVTVKDGSNPVKNAKVEFSIDSKVNGASWKTGTVQTDEFGCAEILSTTDYSTAPDGDLTVTATVSKDGFVTDSTTIAAAEITSDKQNFDVVLVSSAITDVKIESRELTYDGTAQELVSIEGLQERDTVDYGTLPEGVTINDKGNPVATNAGTYNITVTVSRDGKDDLEKIVTTTINKADFTVKLEAKDLLYNETAQDLVTVDGLQIGDKVQWTTTNGATQETYIVDESNKNYVPTATNVGDYKIKLTVERNANYTVYNSEELKASIRATEIEGLSAHLISNLVYNGHEQELVKKDELTGQYVSGLKDGDKVYFIVGNDSEAVKASNAWTELTSDNIPLGKDAGDYTVRIKVVRTNYNETEVELDPATVTIAKAEPDFEFKNENLPTGIVGKYSEIQTDVDFAAADGSQTGGAISYAVAFADAEATQGQNIDDYAVIDENGLLTLKKQTTDLVVTAVLTETENYKSVTLTYNLSVTVYPDNQGEFIVLGEEDAQTYTLGMSLPSNRFEVTERGIKHSVTVFYDSACEKTCTALKGSVSGHWPQYEAHLTWANGGMNEIANRIVAEKDNTLELTVKVTHGTVSKDTDQDYYTLKVSFANFGQGELYTLDGTKASDDNEWYKSAVTVKPATTTDGTPLYTIAKECDLNAFGNSVEFSDQGAKERYVYLKDTNGAIAREKVVDANDENIKIDSLAPDANNMTIDIKNLNIIEKIGYKFGFFNPEVEIKFTVADETETDESGMQNFTVYYTKDTHAAASVVADKSEELTPILEDGKYTATLTIKASELETYRGEISFTATDKAGNVSAEKRDKDNVIVVVDKINPVMSADFKLADSNGKYNSVNTNGTVQHYYDGSVDFTFTITEQNFFSEDVIVKVKKISKGGVETQVVTPTWTDGDNDNHYGKFPLSGDGDYVVTMSYQDQSKNVMLDGDGKEVKLYTSEVITIDTKDPVINSVCNKDDQNITVTIDEHNFRASDITVGVEALDINGQPVSVNDIQAYMQNEDNWTSNGDIHTLVLESTVENKTLVDAIYKLTINYKDISDNPANTETTDSSMIDHTAPQNVDITYSESIIDTVLKTLALGFYNPTVEVTFTATDLTSGVDSFKWGYTKQDDQSDVNRPTDDDAKIETQVVTAEQDNKDKSKFTAKITLPENEAEQLRGNMSVIATDTYGNSSDKVTDNGYVFVVDTISPKMTAEYSKESRMVKETEKKTAYYNGDATVTFTVTEANFFPEDVLVSVSKDGAEPVQITPEWKDESVDVHIGTYTLSGDGDYVVYVKYHDRSQNDLEIGEEDGLIASTTYQETENEYVEYKSHTITIDTIKPVINVEYQNTNLIDTIKDSDGNDRKYFDNTQTAKITIDEHNFVADEVNFKIIAKDVTGKELDVSALNTKSEWSVGENGDIHIITITYPGDANYTFDVAYTDLATNEADDYATDYFTVDKTDPTNMSVSYSTSILDTVLESLTFGFYNAKMTVTLTADDITSGVHNFKYSYLNATGVSSVNAELIDQAIDAADIAYSEDGLTATMIFEIPKMVLGTDNQFNGTVEFTAYDRADNETNQKDTKRIVVDNIAPTANVQYNTPVNEVNGISYYDGDINATVTITEANFYAQDVSVMVTKDGGAPYAVTPSWTDNSVDTHTGTFTLTEDGDYIITINYRDKSTNQMKTYTSNQLTVDTDIQAPTYSINGVAKTEEGGAYKNDATIAFSFEDQNFDTKTIKLERTRFNSVENVTDDFIHSSDTDKGGSGSFDIPSKVENDGIYVLTIGMTDKANHTTESKLKFTINRYGSVYEYSEYLTSLLEKQYIKIDGNNSEAITQDLVITEYNANQILTDSLNILITRDGETIDTKYTSNPTVDSNAGIGDSGWYQYTYTIAKENFAEDGVYKITLTSAYAASDSDRNESTSVPENSIDANGNQILNTMNFTVDTTKPEIRNIVNLDKPIVNAQTLDVDYTIVDVGGLKSIEVIVNGSTIDTITEFGDNAFNYSGSFTLNESSDAQTVQIKVTDIAGNVTDTASDDFSTNDLYVFNDTITVSTNFFVRWYANKLLFWGSIGGVVVLAGAIWFLIAFKRRKKEDEEAK